MSNQIFHFSNSGISSGQRFYLKDDVSGIFLRNLNIDSNFPVVASNLVYNTGDQTISGVKTFATGVNISGHVGIGIDNNNFNLYVRKSPAGVTVNPDVNSIAVFEGSGNSHITILASDSQAGGVVLGSPADNFGAYLTWNHDNNALKLATANPNGFIQLLTNNEAEAVRITSGANVGIGTTSPSEKLEVIGNILANNLVYNTGDQTISGVKTFIGNHNISGNLNVTGNIFLSGNPVLTGSNHTHLWSQSIYDSQAGGSDAGFAGRNGGGNLVLHAGTQSTSVPSFYGWNGFLNTSFTAATARTNLELTSTATAVENTFVRTTGDQTISGVKTFIGNHNISGNLNVTGNSNIRGTLDVTGLVVSGLGTPFILKSASNANSVSFNPTQNGDAGALTSNYLYSIELGHIGDENLTLSYGGGGTRNITFRGGGANISRAILDSNGNFGIGSGISSVPSRFYVSGDSLLQGNLTTSGSGIFTSGIDLNNSKLINATPDLLNVSENFNITGTQNSRVILANSPTIITGSIVSGNPIGFNTSIIQISSGQVLITGIGSNVIVNSYNNQFRTAAQYATISILHTGNDGYIMYGNTST